MKPSNETSVLDLSRALFRNEVCVGGRLGVVSDLEDAVDVGISGGSISGQLSFFTLVRVSAKVTCPRKEGTVSFPSRSLPKQFILVISHMALATETATGM
jgi:hypothetical protein